MNRELFFSILLFTISSFASLYIYTSVAHNEQQHGDFLSKIDLGESHYDLIHNGSCIGHARKSLVASTDLIELKSEGSFYTKYLNNVTRQDYTFNATFNSLGQLGGSLAKLSMGDKYISIGSIEIDPITIKLRTNAFNAPLERSWSIPGPIQIKKNNDNSYRIEYSLLKTFIQRSHTLAAQPIMQSVNILPNKVSEAAKLCTISSKTALDINPIMTDAYKLLQSIQAYSLE